ncbi:protein of unknown function DUF243 [Trinorchestia longiramus]|nr:protein of unknown function DUF243 [Trinorchestia longiramus]
MIALSAFIVVLIAAVSDTDASRSGSYYAPPCPQGEIKWVDGSCIPPVINKRFFTFQSPQHKRPKSNVQVFNNPNRDFNYVFVRAPEVRFKEQIVVGPPKQQSLIYLLSQGNQVVPREVIQLPAQNERPEVYYINYNDPNEDLELPGGINLQTALAQQTHTGQFISSGGGSYGADTSLFARIDQLQEFQGPQTVEYSFPDDKTITGIGASDVSSIDEYRQPIDSDSQGTASVIQTVSYYNTADSKSSEKSGLASASALSSPKASNDVSGSSAKSSSFATVATGISIDNDDDASSSTSSVSSSSDDGSSSVSTSFDDYSGSDDDEHDNDSSSSSAASSSSSSSKAKEQGSSVESSSSPSSSPEGLDSSTDGNDGGSVVSSSSSSSASSANSKESTGASATSSAPATSLGGRPSSIFGASGRLTSRGRINSRARNFAAAPSVSSGTVSTTVASSGAAAIKSSSLASSSGGSDSVSIPLASTVTTGSSTQSDGSASGLAASGTSASSSASSASIDTTGSVIDIAAPVVGSNILKVVQVDSLPSTGSVDSTAGVITTDPVAEFISSIGGDDFVDDASAKETQTISQNIADLGFGKSASTGENTVSASASSSAKSSISSEGGVVGGESISSGDDTSLTDVISEPVALQSGPALGADVIVQHVPKIVSNI